MLFEMLRSIVDKTIHYKLHFEVCFKDGSDGFGAAPQLNQLTFQTFENNLDSIIALFGRLLAYYNDLQVMHISHPISCLGYVDFDYW